MDKEPLPPIAKGGTSSSSSDDDSDQSDASSSQRRGSDDTASSRRRVPLAWQCMHGVVWRFLLFPIGYVLCTPCRRWSERTARGRRWKRKWREFLLFVAELRTMDWKAALRLIWRRTVRAINRFFAKPRRLRFMAHKRWDYVWWLTFAAWIVLVPIYLHRLLHPDKMLVEARVKFRPKLQLVVDENQVRATGLQSGEELLPQQNEEYATWRTLSEPAITPMLRAATALLAAGAALPAMGAVSLQKELAPKMWRGARAAAALRLEWGFFFMMSLTAAPVEDAHFPDPRGPPASLLLKYPWQRTHVWVGIAWVGYLLLCLWSIGLGVYLLADPDNPALTDSRTGLLQGPPEMLVYFVATSAFVCALSLPLVHRRMSPCDCLRRRRYGPDGGQVNRRRKIMTRAQVPSRRKSAESAARGDTATAGAQQLGKLRGNLRTAMLQKGLVGGGGAISAFSGQGESSVMAAAVMRAIRARENAKLPLSAADDATMRSYVPPMRGAMPPGVFHRASTVPRHSNLGMRQLIRGEGLRKAVPRVIPSQLGEGEPEEEDTDTMSDDKFEAMQKLTMLDMAPSMGGRPGLVTDEKGQGHIKGRALPSAGTKRELLFDIQRGRYRGDGSRANFDHTVDHINRVTAAKKLGFKRFLMNGSEGADGAQLDAATRQLASNSEEVEQIAQVRFAATKLGSLPAIGKIARTVHRRSRAAIRADPAPPPSSYSRFSAMVLLIAFTWGPSFAFGILTFGMPPFVLGIVVLVMACVMLQATARGLLPLVFAPDIPALSEREKQRRADTKKFAALREERDAAERLSALQAAVEAAASSQSRLQPVLRFIARVRLAVFRTRRSSAAQLARVCAILRCTKGARVEPEADASEAKVPPKTKAKVKNQNNDKDGGLAYTYNYPPPAVLPMHLNERAQRGRDRCIMFIACLPSILILVFSLMLTAKLAAYSEADGVSVAGLGPAGGLSWHTVFAPLYVQMVLTPFMAVGKSGAVSLSFLLIAIPLALFFIAVSQKREFSAVPNPMLIRPNYRFEYLAVDTKKCDRKTVLNEAEISVCDTPTQLCWAEYNKQEAMLGDKGVWLERGKPNQDQLYTGPLWFDAASWKAARTTWVNAMAQGDWTRVICGPEKLKWFVDNTVPDELASWPVIFAPVYAATLFAFLLWRYYPAMVRPLHQRSLAHGTDRARFKEPEHVSLSGPNNEALAAGRAPRQNMLRPITIAGLQQYSVADVPPGVYWDELRLRWQSVHSDDFDEERATVDPLMPSTKYLDPRGEIAPELASISLKPEPVTSEFVSSDTPLPSIEDTGEI